MKIAAIYTHNVGPLQDKIISMADDWTDDVEKRVLFTGSNGCGKSTVLKSIAMLWEAAAYWLDHQKALPQKHESRAWLQHWGGVAVVFDDLQPFYDQPVGLIFGEHSWVKEIMEQHPNVSWVGQSKVHTGFPPRKAKVDIYLPADEAWFHEWANHRKRMILSYDKVDSPNMIYLDAEERRWVKPKRNIAEPLPDLLSQRWLTRYIVTEDWKGQLEASLITLKTTQLHLFHDVVRHLNDFLMGKEIDTDMKAGEGRLRVRIKNRKGVYHSLDELSAGEHQVLIMIYIISRWMQSGGIVLIDEPDLYLHPSLVDPLLSSLEKLVAEHDGQLLITSHAIDIWRRYENHGKRIELKLDDDGQQA